MMRYVFFRGELKDELEDEVKDETTRIDIREDLDVIEIASDLTTNFDDEDERRDDNCRCESESLLNALSESNFVTSVIEADFDFFA